MKVGSVALVLLNGIGSLLSWNLEKFRQSLASFTGAEPAATVASPFWPVWRQPRQMCSWPSSSSSHCWRSQSSSGLACIQDCRRCYRIAHPLSIAKQLFLVLNRSNWRPWQYISFWKEPHHCRRYGLFHSHRESVHATSRFTQYWLGSAPPHVHFCFQSSHSDRKFFW